MGLIALITGLAVGSFLNAYIFRTQPSPSPLPAGEGGRRSGEGSVWHGRSMCPKCRKSLAWYELIPLVSFVAQRGRCRGCKQRIDFQYPLVELATGILFAAAYYQLPAYLLTFVPTYLISGYLLAVLVVLFVYDLRYGLVPDRVVLPAIVVAFFYNVIPSAARNLWRMPAPTFVGDSSDFGFRMTLWEIMLAIAIGSGFFALQYYLSRGRWLGAGDIRIGALMGAMLGWPLVLAGLIVSYIIGGVVALVLIALRKKHFGQTLPLGTFLTLGTAIVFLYGQIIWQWYFNV